MTLTREVIVPLMRRVGEAWNADQLRIAHEHIISGQLRSLLGTLMRHEQPPAGLRESSSRPLPVTCTSLAPSSAPSWPAGRGFEPIYLGTHMPLDEVAEAAEQSGAVLVLLSIALSIARDCEPGEAHQLIAGLSSLAKQHEVWLGIPEQRELSRSPLPARLFHRYEDLDVALTSQPDQGQENFG